jgi:colanic acid/amylovoran biosynthesis glycosyltransferase
MRVAYVLSRFPLTTETFILREFDALDRREDTEVELFALFPSDDQVVHAEARPWLGRCHRPRPAAALRDLARWTVRRPGTVLRVLARVLADHAGRPRTLGKALATTVIAMQHAETVRARGVEHVHAHFATFPALVAWVCGQLTGVRWSVTPHAHDIFISQAGLRTKLEAASAVVAVSRYHRMFLQHFGATPARLLDVSYGLDLEAHAFRPRAVPAEGDVDVLCVSSFKPYKGHRVLLEALAAVADDPGAGRLQVELIGGGGLEDEVRRHASELGLEGRVTFSGPRDQAYVRQRLEEAHVLVQPSLVQRDGDTEGLPNTIIEAAANGVLVVATSVAGVPELIDDRSGVLVGPADPEALAAGLRRAAGLGEAAVELQREARRRVEARHDLRGTTTALREAFGALGRR